MKNDTKQNTSSNKCEWCQRDFDKCTCGNILDNNLDELLDDIDNSYTDVLKDND
jgi:hypothetical protein